MRRLINFLTLLAVLVMPFGMTAVPAAQVTDHHPMAGMRMGHCPDEGTQPDTEPGIQACAMVCAAALPAMEVDREQPAAIVCAPDRSTTMRYLQGLHPETATPPPKRS